MKIKIATLTLIAVTFIALIIGGIHTYLNMEPEQVEPTREIASVPEPPVEEVFPHVIEPKSTLYSVLSQLQVSPQTIHQIVNAAKPVHDLRRLLPGTRFQLFHSTESAMDLMGIKFRFSPIEYLEIKKAEAGWVAEKIKEPVDIRVVTYSGVVTSTLWESAESAKMDPYLISELSEIFGWQVDFAREVRINDRWRLSVERKFARGQHVGWGSILSAEYENAGELYTAILFRQDGQDVGYFAPDGSSLRRMFLKSPIRFARISSRFQKNRFHPILKINRPHLGVDYAAPIGTPVRSVGAGVITYIGRNGGAGNVIRVRHNSTYETAYKHLNGFAKGLHRGAKVQQGQTIGYVGNTGLSTGPHLHFEFFQNGRYVDPLGKKFPTADPVPATHLAEFQTEAQSLMTLLPSWESLEVTARENIEPEPSL